MDLRFQLWLGTRGSDLVPGPGTTYMISEAEGVASRLDQDRLLLAKVVRGDHRALTDLYDRHASVAFGLALRICKNQAIAEDAVQEAFVSIWQKAGSFDPERGSVSVYLLSVVHHKAVDAVRHEAAMHRRQGVAASQIAEDTLGDDVAEAAWITVRRQKVRAAVEALSHVQRQALDLAYFRGLSYSEVAKELAIPLGTVKTRIRDGMIRLRYLLAHLEPDPVPAISEGRGGQ